MVCAHERVVQCAGEETWGTNRWNNSPDVTQIASDRIQIQIEIFKLHTFQSSANSPMWVKSARNYFSLAVEWSQSCNLSIPLLNPYSHKTRHRKFTCGDQNISFITNNVKLGERMRLRCVLIVRLQNSSLQRVFGLADGHTYSWLLFLCVESQ